MVVVALAEVAFARAGDKGDTSDISVFAPARDVYDVLVTQVSAERVAALLQPLVQGPVTRYEVPNLLALKFVCAAALGGGGPTSLRADNLGKALGGAVLRLPVELPDELLVARRLPRAPRDPYAQASWVARAGHG